MEKYYGMNIYHTKLTIPPLIHSQTLKQQQSNINNHRMSLFLLGGTGKLGSLLAKGLRTATGFTSYKAIVRSTDSPKAQALRGMGWELVQVSDGKDVEALTSALQGAQTVVSTLGGADLAALETTAVQASKAAGATLFVPSQFGVDYRVFGDDFPLFQNKQKVLAAAEAAGLPTLKVFVGFFSDFIFGFFANVEEGMAKLIGDLDGGKMSFTKRADIGYVLARALQSDHYNGKGGFLSMSAETLTWKE